jgi:undecaprenyl-phosphate 4-deoxy-4-formamido-L-arabinose transferase
MESNVDISVIIPVYNAGKCIEQLVTDLHYELLSQSYSFEIILVDDASTDNSWTVIKKLKNKLPDVKGILLSRNFGQHKATFCGLNVCKGEIVITMDDDFEHPVKTIHEGVNKLKGSNADIVYAVSPKSNSLFRNMASRFYKFISRVENKEAGKGSSFRFMRKNLVRSLTQHNGHMFFIDEMLLWHTSHITAIETTFGVSQKEASGYTYRGLFALSRNVFYLSTTMPLRFVKTVGFSMAGISFLTGAYYLLRKLIFRTPPGYTSIIVSILFGVGMILFCLGIIGEYVGNILMMQNQKPAFTIKEEA